MNGSLLSIESNPNYINDSQMIDFLLMFLYEVLVMDVIMFMASLNDDLID